jgi:hypothetical protein
MAHWAKARASRPGDPRDRADPPELLLAAELGFHPFAGIASRLHSLAHLAGRASSLLCLVGHFVLLPAGDLRPVLRTSTVRFSHRCLHWQKSFIVTVLVCPICRTRPKRCVSQLRSKSARAVSTAAPVALRAWCHVVRGAAGSQSMRSAALRCDSRRGAAPCAGPAHRAPPSAPVLREGDLMEWTPPPVRHRSAKVSATT